MPIREIAKTIKLSITSNSNMKKIDKLLESGLPKQMKPVLEYLVTGKCDEKTNTVIKSAESRRRAIASQGKKEVPIWYSPKPGSAVNDTSLDARPKPGKVLYFTMERVAATGKNKTWGTVLYLIARDFQANTVFELGSCAGISAIYMCSAQSVEKLITVEGSKALAEIAGESLQAHKCARVVNSLFDEAIDSELPSLGQEVDFAYIDGHHEKVATIHYFNRLLPFLKRGAVVVFDDISWSHDMRDAWDILSKRSEFSHAMDLGAIGVCILKTMPEDGPSEPKSWDLQAILGKSRIGEPHGWKE